MPAVFHRRRPTAFENLLRQGAQVTDTRHDWTTGLLMMLAAVLALGLIDANDRAVDEREATARAEQRAARWQGIAQTIEKAPAVRLDGDTFACRNFNIRREWTAAVAQECERMAGLLRTARATQ